MLKYIRNIVVAFLIPVVFSIAHAAQVDINTADALTLAQSVNGIGPSKAQAIVDYRESNGPFATLDDLVKVQGIGFKTLNRIREFVIVGPADSGTSPSPVSETPASEEQQPALQAN